MLSAVIRRTISYFPCGARMPTGSTRSHAAQASIVCSRIGICSSFEYATNTSIMASSFFRFYGKHAANRDCASDESVAGILLTLFWVGDRLGLNPKVHAGKRHFHYVPHRPRRSRGATHGIFLY